MSESIEVRLTNQSFMDAGGPEVFPGLEMENVFSVIEKSSNNGFYSTSQKEAVEKATRALRDAAQQKGYTHVFRVEYHSRRSEDGHQGHNYVTCEARGTGYKPRED